MNFKLKYFESRQNIILACLGIGIIFVLIAKLISYNYHINNLDGINAQIGSAHFIQSHLLSDDVLGNTEELIFHINHISSLDVVFLDLKLDLIELSQLMSNQKKMRNDKVDLAGLRDLILPIEHISSELRPIVRRSLNTINVLDDTINLNKKRHEYHSLLDSVARLVEVVESSTISNNVKIAMNDDLEAFLNQLDQRLSYLMLEQSIQSLYLKIQTNRNDALLALDNSISFLHSEREKSYKSFRNGLMAELVLVLLFISCLFGGILLFLKESLRKSRKSINRIKNEFDLQEKMIDVLRIHINLPIVLVDNENRIKWCTIPFLNLVDHIKFDKTSWSKLLNQKIISTSRDTNIYDSVKFRKDLSRDFTLKSKLCDVSPYKGWKVYTFIELTSYYKELKIQDKSFHDLYPQSFLNHLESCEIVSALQETIKLSCQFVGAENISFNSRQVIPCVVSISEVAFQKRVKPLLDGIFAFIRRRSSKPVFVECSYLASGISLTITCADVECQAGDLETDFGHKGRSYTPLGRLFKMFEGTSGEFKNSVSIKNIKRGEEKSVHFLINFQLNQSVSEIKEEVQNFKYEIQQ